VVAADAKRQHLSVAASDAANWQVRPAAGHAPPVCGAWVRRLGARWSGTQPDSARHRIHAAHCKNAWQHAYIDDKLTQSSLTTS